MAFLPGCLDAAITMYAAHTLADGITVCRFKPAKGPTECLNTRACFFWRKGSPLE